MAKLPSNFSSSPDQDPHKYFKNLLIDFKKAIENNSNIDILQQNMEALINAAKQMQYIDQHKKSIYHKPETTKALSKIWTEFDRYFITKKNTPKKANPNDLLEAIILVENLLNNFNIY